jgi:urea transporter
MKRYWFRQKQFGYGATPNTWEGWLLTVVGILLVTGIVFLGPSIRDNGLRALWVALGIPAVLVPFCVVAWLKTEGGWRWRSGE